MIRALKLGFLLMLFFAAAVIRAETVIPDSTAVPVQLETAISSKNAKLGQVIKARVMQSVPLPGDAEIPAGSTLIGKVTAVQAASGINGGSISFRFDVLQLKHENVHLTVRLRAIASDGEVHEAQLPRNPDPSIPQNAWNTVQIGGDVVYRGGGSVRNRAGVVGRPVLNGVLVRMDSNPGRGCHDDGTGERAQAMWVFSTDACGVYGFSDATIVRPDHDAPASAADEIALHSAMGNVDLRNGTGFLLRVDNPGITGA